MVSVCFPGQSGPSPPDPVGMQPGSELVRCGWRVEGPTGLAVACSPHSQLPSGSPSTAAQLLFGSGVGKEATTMHRDNSAQVKFTVGPLLTSVRLQAAWAGGLSSLLSTAPGPLLQARESEELDRGELRFLGLGGPWSGSPFLPVPPCPSFRHWK